MSDFTVIFVFLVFINILVKLFLARRHSSYVKSQSNAVPSVFSDTISAESHYKAAQYTVAKTRLSMWKNIFSIVVMLAFTLGGGLDWLNQHVNFFTSPLLNGLTLIVVFTAIHMVLDLPFEYYSSFVLEQNFGFNKMTHKLFWLDGVKSAVVGGMIGIPLLFAVLWLLQVAGQYWWFYTWLLWQGFVFLMMVLYPKFIAPWFNKFSPLEDESLKSRIAGLMQRCGFLNAGLFVVNGSLRSSHGNAYFTGLGKAKRIVFYDTLLKQLNHAEVEAVLAHELGHFKHRHILKNIVSSLVASFFLLALLAFLKDQLWFYHSLGVSSAPRLNGDAVVLLLFSMVLPLLSFFWTPLSALVSRRYEFQADAFAAKNASAQDLMNALVKMYRDNASTLTPDAWYVRFYYSHPPALARINALQGLSQKA